MIILATFTLLGAAIGWAFSYRLRVQYRNSIKNYWWARVDALTAERDAYEAQADRLADKLASSASDAILFRAEADHNRDLVAQLDARLESTDRVRSEFLDLMNKFNDV